MVLTALILGFAGSLHCLGMCSPLVMAATSMKKSVLLHRLLYNAGRTLTYGMLGIVVSASGATLALARYQNLLSIVLGVSLFIIGIFGIGGVKIPLLTNRLQQFVGFLKTQFAKYLQQKSYGAVVMLGALNGLLPCGLTFLALSYCITLSSALDGFWFMLLFGVGTLPVMLGFTSVLHSLISVLRINMQRMTTILFIASGSLLIVRVLIHATEHATPEQGVVDIVLCR